MEEDLKKIKEQVEVLTKENKELKEHNTSLGDKIKKYDKEIDDLKNSLTKKGEEEEEEDGFLGGIINDNKAC